MKNDLKSDPSCHRMCYLHADFSPQKASQVLFPIVSLGCTGAPGRLTETVT
jgi:hypothetical protein